MTSVVGMLAIEEGFREKPYLCSEGYPTVGFGFKLGPKCSEAECERLYTFTLPREAADEWLRCLLMDLVVAVADHPRLSQAYSATAGYPARRAVLISMAYQMGIDGLAGFKNTLRYIAVGQYTNAAANMLKSKWARQTPRRAARHAEQMASGKWCKEYAE